MAQEELAKDYATYFNKSNISKEIDPICANIDEMMTRLEEFESILQIVKNDSSMATNQNLPKIISFKSGFDQLCERIDDLEKFVDVVDNNLDNVEKQIQIAEEELDIPDKAFNVFLKSINIFGKPKSSVKETNLNSEGFYEPVPIFKTGDYFPKETELVKMK